MSAFKDLRKLLNEALDVVEAEVEKAGNGPRESFPGPFPP
jgi:hypothetical protein